MAFPSWWYQLDQECASSFALSRPNLQHKLILSIYFLHVARRIFSIAHRSFAWTYYANLHQFVHTLQSALFSITLKVHLDSWDKQVTVPNQSSIRRFACTLSARQSRTFVVLHWICGCFDWIWYRLWMFFVHKLQLHHGLSSKLVEFVFQCLILLCSAFPKWNRKVA